MTNLKTYLLLTILALSSLNTSAQDEEMLKWAMQGAVTKTNYDSEIPFRYVDGYIFVDIVQNDKVYNFLFDTGAEATLIDKSIIKEFSFKPFSTSTIAGPLITAGDVSTITLSSIHVSDVQFTDIGAVAFDLSVFDSKFCNKVDGMLGTTLLKKAKWQIDYQKKVIRFSDALSNLMPQTATYTLTTQLPAWGYGTETIELTIDGYVSKFNFDTGNGRSKIVANPNKIKNFTSLDKSSILEYGFRKSATNYKFISKSITIGGISFNNQTVSLENEVGNEQLLGNRFFENFVVTIDWEKHQIYLEPSKETQADKLVGFELNFKPNFKSNQIEIETGLQSFTKENKIEEGTIVLKVNEKDVSTFSHQEFCDFWTLEWTKLIEVDQINIVISQKGKTKELLLTKKELI